MTVGISTKATFEQCALASGLLVREQFDKVRRSLCANDDMPCDEKLLANRAVELGFLNPWQASQLLDGRTRFTLGPYKIVDSLGQGGMGQVFKAEHVPSGRIVAVKVLPKAKSTPDAIRCFEHEIQSLARMDHHKLVRAIDTGHDGNVYYLVTEYVPGCDLRKLVRRDGPLNMEQAAAIIYQVAEGLSHAHLRGLIHRDVKPGNVLVTPEGEAKLSDLGLAGPTSGDAEKDPRFGKIVGTADYLSPDHVKAPWDPQPAWDIYSLGCTLYYAITGKVPFPGGTTSDKARAHCELRPLDPRRLSPNLSAEFVDVLADMMAKDPAQRIRSADEVMLRLLPWIKRPLPGPVKAAEQSERLLERQFAPLAIPPGIAQRDAVSSEQPTGWATKSEARPIGPKSESERLSDTMDDCVKQIILQASENGAATPAIVPVEIVQTPQAVPAPPPVVVALPVPPPVMAVDAVQEASERSPAVPFWQQYRLPLLMAAVGVPTILLFGLVIFALVRWLAS